MTLRRAAVLVYRGEGYIWTMADANNHLAGRIPETPDPTLRTLEPLLGAWRASGGIEGVVSFEWLDGGYFLVQHVDLLHGSRSIHGIEYIGFDTDTCSLRSHYMDNHGSNFSYTWELDGDAIRIWFGDRGSETLFEGTFSPDRKSYSGWWRWPGGGYPATMTRVG